MKPENRLPAGLKWDITVEELDGAAGALAGMLLPEASNSPHACCPAMPVLQTAVVVPFPTKR